MDGESRVQLPRVITTVGALTWFDYSEFNGPQMTFVWVF
jgi:hypothetical protein